MVEKLTVPHNQRTTGFGRSGAGTAESRRRPDPIAVHRANLPGRRPTPCPRPGAAVSKPGWAVKDEIYTKVGQIDYAAEIAQIRAAKPDAVYFFLPAAMGINFIKQYVGGGLKDIPLIAPGFSADQGVIAAVGEPMLG